MLLTQGPCIHRRFVVAEAMLACRAERLGLGVRSTLTHGQRMVQIAEGSVLSQLSFSISQ